jgi:V/A-type H+-transporting ATPase subunit K
MHSARQKIKVKRGKLFQEDFIMTLATQITLIVTLILSIILPFGYYLIGVKNRTRYKRALGINVFFFFGVLVISTILMFSGAPAYAASADLGTEVPVIANVSQGMGLGYIAAGLATGLSCVGGGIAVGNTASAALGAISEDDSILGKSLIFVGLAEGVCLYGLVVSFMILGKF